MPLSPSADPAPALAEGAGRILRLATDDESTGPSAQPRGAMHVRLYHFPTSLCSQKVRLALAEKGVAWQSTIVNIGPAHEQLQPWYAQINPRLVVPTLVLDDEVVTDSRQIVESIDRRFPGPTLIPAELADEVMRWVDLQDRLPMRELELAQTKGLVRWLRRWGLKQKRKQLRKLIRKQPELAAVYQAKLDDLDQLERAVAGHAATRELVDEIEVVLDGLEHHLGEHRWLAGDRYTLADLVWTAVIARLEHIGFARTMAAHRRPHIADWYARLRERPSWDAMVRRLTVGQALRYYGPAVLKTFLLVWVLKWVVVIGLGWALTAIDCGGG
ncbi:glutathione S-transferase family protein [Nannocystaceae bacterium ST9]